MGNRRRRPTTAGPDRLTALPPELRFMIYEYLLYRETTTSAKAVEKPRRYIQCRGTGLSLWALQRTNKFFRAEIRGFCSRLHRVFLRTNTFFMPNNLYKSGFRELESLLQPNFQCVTHLEIVDHINPRFSGADGQAGNGYSAIAKLPCLRVLQFRLYRVETKVCMTTAEWVSPACRYKFNLCDLVLQEILPRPGDVIKLHDRLIIKIHGCLSVRLSNQCDGQPTIIYICLSVANIGSRETLWVPSPSVKVWEDGLVLTSAPTFSPWTYHSNHLATMVESARASGQIAAIGSEGSLDSRHNVGNAPICFSVKSVDWYSRAVYSERQGRLHRRRGSQWMGGLRWRGGLQWRGGPRRGRGRGLPRVEGL